MAPKVKPNDYLIIADTVYLFLVDKKGGYRTQAMIDVEDLLKVSVFRWYYKKPYAATEVRGFNLFLHVFIMDTWKMITNKEIDHIDGNGLNNKKENLQIVSRSKNLLKAKVRKDNRSGCKGVTWSKSKRKWQVSVTINKKRHHFGAYKNLEDAIEAKKIAERKFRL